MTRTADLRRALLGASALTAAIFVASLPGQAAAQTVVIGGNTGDDETRVIGVGENVWASFVTVGGSGRGVLTVQSGGRLQASTIIAGAYAQGVGIVNATGAGTQINATGNVYIGDYSRGELTVSDGATVRSRYDIVLGRNANGVAVVQVTGAGSSLVSDAWLTVSMAGRAELSIANGGRASAAGTLLLGAYAGGHGVVTVSDVGSSLTAGADMLIGRVAYGELNVTNGATATAGGNIIIGNGAGATGVVTVTGAGSSLLSSGDMHIGDAGNGQLTVSAGGAVNVGGRLYVVTQAGSQGSVLVTGQGSSLTVRGIRTDLGAAGSRGELTVSNGGLFSTQRLGVYSGSIINVTGANSSLNITQWFDTSNGTITVADGAAMTVGTNVDMSFASGSNSVVNVIGTDSFLSVGGPLTLGFNGTAELNVRDGARVDVQGGTLIARETTSAGTLTVGGASGSAATGAGSINGNITFGAGDGALVLNHNTANYAYTGAIGGTTSGQGRIRFEAGRTQFNTTNAGFTGVSDIFSGASLYLNGALGGTLNVLAGGELLGVGTVGALNVTGAVRMGGDNAIARFNGDSANFNAGSLFVVDFVGAQSDSIVLTGAANIAAGSILRVITNPAGVYTAGDRSVILSAAGGLTGRFTLEGGPRALTNFLSLRDGYSATEAYLEVAVVSNFATAGVTANQQAVAAGLQSLGSGSVLFNAIANMPNNAAAQVAFDALSGELHPGVRGVLTRDAYQAQRIVIRNGATDDREAGPRAWGEVWTNSGRADGDGNAERLDADTVGFFAGADVHVGGGWRLGAALGYDQGDVDARRGEGQADITRSTVLAYFDGQLNGWALRGGLGYTDASIETQRLVIFPSPVINVNETLKADYDGSITHAYLDASYGFAFSGAKVAPFLNLSRVSVDTDAFSETGGIAALDVEKASADLTFTTLGVRAGEVSFAGATLTGSAGWRYASGDRDATGVHSLAGGAGFAVRGVETERSAAVIDVDAQWRPRANLGIGAGASFVGASGQSDFGVRLSARYSF